MKVAYNNCFGGFSLSPVALTLFAKKKGITLTWYIQTGYAHQGNESYTKAESIPEHRGMGNCPLIEDCGETINKIPNKSFYYPDLHDDARADPDLISVIETLGAEANGMCSDLQIETIPDGSSFEITEYDGNESVEPPRQSW